MNKRNSKNKTNTKDKREKSEKINMRFEYENYANST